MDTETETETETVSAEKARGLLVGTAPGTWLCWPEDGVVWLGTPQRDSVECAEFADAQMIAAAPDLARTVIALHEEVGRLREAIRSLEPVEWYIEGDETKRMDCPFCGEVSVDGLEMPHGYGCVWWELNNPETEEAP